MKKQIQTPAFQNIYTDYDLLIKASGLKGKMYQSNVKDFLIWMEEHGVSNIKDVKTKTIMNYYEFLQERPNKTKGGTLADSTITVHLSSLSILVEQLLEKGELVKAFSIPRHGKGNQKAMGYLTVEEVKILYENSENPLERAILSLAYGCGLRRSEIEKMNTIDIQLSTGMLVVRNGKGDKRREVPMSDAVLNDIKTYITEYRYQRLINKSHQTALFINRKGNRMSGEIINNTLKKIIERSQNQTIINKEISLHCLRHSIAHHLMENNAGIGFIRSFLGHSFINTSYIYAVKNKKRTKATKQHYQLTLEPSYG